MSQRQEIENHANLNITETSVKDFNLANKNYGKFYLKSLKRRRKCGKENKFQGTCK